MEACLAVRKPSCTGLDSQISSSSLDFVIWGWWLLVQPVYVATKDLCILHDVVAVSPSPQLCWSAACGLACLVASSPFSLLGEC